MTTPSSRLRAPSRWALASVVFLLVRPAAARVYPVPIEVDNEDDLQSLYADGLLTEEDFLTLQELLNNPVDINRAGRDDLYDLPGLSNQNVEAILGYRKKNGPFVTVQALRQVSGITDEIIEGILPFCKAGLVEKKALKVPVRGRLRTRAAMAFEPVEEIEDDSPAKTHTPDQLGYANLPAAYIAGEVEAWRWLEAGVLAVAQQDVNGVVYDAEHRSFLLSYGPVAQIGRAYVAAHRIRSDAVLGTYSAGFGMGLVFDNTNRSHPHGLYPDLTVSGTDDFSLSKRLFGIGARGFGAHIGAASLDATVFASSARYDTYQYDIGVAGGEKVDPLTAELASPTLYLDGQKVGYLTIPNTWRETLAGGNATVRWNDRIHVGLTTYVGSQDRSVLPGVEDDWDLVLRDGMPARLVYGAVGADAAWGRGPFDLSAELSHSFSAGNGYLVQAIYGRAKTEVELTLRRYETDFDNPHARGVSNADTYGGQRDRDEQGVRLKAQARPIKQLSVRGYGDLWQNISKGVWNIDVYGRAAWDPNRKLSLAAFAQHRDRNLGVDGRTRIYGGSDDSLDTTINDSVGDELDTDSTDPTTTDADPTNRAGAREDLGVQIGVEPIKTLSFGAFYKRYYEDAGLLYPDDGGPCQPWYEIGQYTWFKVRYKPVDNTAVTARVRYVDDDIYGSLGDRQIESYLQVEQKLPKRIKISARATLGRDLLDGAAPWKEACDSQGEPSLVEGGTCVVSTDEEAETVDKKKPYGAAWLGAELRF